MSRKRPFPKFSGPLGKPIYEPISSGGVLALPHDEKARRERIVAEWVTKLRLLPEHYGVDRSDPKAWELTCLHLALDFVPGMQVAESRPPKPGRKRTWQAGLGDDLIRAVEERLASNPSPIGEALKHLRRADEKWKRYPPQTLAARFRDARAARKRRDEEMAKLLAGDGYMSLAKLAEQYQARMRMGGVFGLGEAAMNTASDRSDEKERT